MPRSLEGMRVLDLTHMLAGPFATYQLGLHGAEVIKLEPPIKGEPMRWSRVNGKQQMSPSFLAINAGKRSIAVDLKSPRGRELVLRLASQADVFVENFRPGVIQTLGLDYATVAALNPKVVYCSVSGFGQEGALRDRPAYDHVVQATTGMGLVNGDADSAPVKVGFPVVDIATGMNAASAILAALLRRERSGLGQYIDVSMIDSAATLMFTAVTGYLASGSEPARVGNRGFTGSPGCDTFETADGHIAIGANTGAQFMRLCQELGLAGILSDASLIDPQSVDGSGQGFVRAVDAPAVRWRLTQALRAKTAVEWEHTLNALEVPAARLRSVGQFTDEALARIPGTILPLPPSTDTGKSTRTLNVGHRTLRDSPGTELTAADLGADTRSVLRGAGLTDAQIEALHVSGIIGMST